jgi:glycosyltransferase involved in cell wall biosynthesis
VRIAIVHSFYSSAYPSGENNVVLDQARELRAAGHDVLLVARHTDNRIKRHLDVLRAGGRVATGYGTNPLAELEAFRPDVVHIHNMFPNFGWAWVRQWGGPIALSLHNYRLWCSNGLLYRAGRPCSECSSRGNHNAVRHSCYRNSALATAPVAMSRRRERESLLSTVDAIITTSVGSDRVVRGLAGAGLKTSLIPNFGPGDSDSPSPYVERKGWVTLGRFSQEKGFIELIADWPDGMQLTLIGAGELAGDIHRLAASKEVRVQGTMPREELRRILSRHVGLVFPSRWFEVAPQVVVEAMRVGLPVVAFEGNTVADMVADSGAGAVYSDGASLQRALTTVEQSCDILSRAAVQYYQRTWHPDVWMASITTLYRSLRDGGTA